MSEETMAMDRVDDVEEENGRPEEDFGALFEKESKMPGRLTPGQKIKTTVISVSGDLVYVDMGGKSEGAIGLSEFVKEDGTGGVAEGDEVEAFFLAVQNGVKRLTTRIRGYSTLDVAGIRDAFHANLPVTGKVKAAIKGGYEVTVGGARCFCPFSQMDLKVSRESDAYVGQTFSFKVVEFENDGRNVVLSRRALLEEERRAQAERLKETLSVGMELHGHGPVHPGLRRLCRPGRCGRPYSCERDRLGQGRKTGGCALGRPGSDVKDNRSRLGEKPADPEPQGPQGRPVGGCVGEIRGRHQGEGCDCPACAVRRFRQPGAGHRRPDPHLQSWGGKTYQPPEGSGRGGAVGRAACSWLLTKPTRRYPSAWSSRKKKSSFRKWETWLRQR